MTSQGEREDTPLAACQAGKGTPAPVFGGLPPSTRRGGKGLGDTGIQEAESGRGEDTPCPRAGERTPAPAKLSGRSVSSGATEWYSITDDGPEGQVEQRLMLLGRCRRQFVAAAQLQQARQAWERISINGLLHLPGELMDDKFPESNIQQETINEYLEGLEAGDYVRIWTTSRLHQKDTCEAGA